MIPAFRVLTDHDRRALLRKKIVTHLVWMGFGKTDRILKKKRIIKLSVLAGELETSVHRVAKGKQALLLLLRFVQQQVGKAAELFKLLGFHAQEKRFLAHCNARDVTGAAVIGTVEKKCRRW